MSIYIYMAEISGIKSNANAKLRAYYAEIARKRYWTLFYFSIVAAFTLLFIMLVSGDRFNLQGISNPAGGVFADCNLAQNQDSPYCQSKPREQEKNWKKITRGGGEVPFTLHNR